MSSQRCGMRFSAAHKWILFGLIVTLTSGVSAGAQQYGQEFYGEMRWRCIGPFRGGRTVAITGVPRQPNVFYMAAVNGGVWRTTDSGNTWKPIFDNQPTGSVGAIAIAPSDSNILYVGSGEGLQRPDLSTGDGGYKSSDGGKTWQHLGLPDAQRGVFRSTDGGQSFQKVLYKDENTGAADLVFDPANSQTIYAALWAARVAPWEIRSGESFIAAGSGLFKSTDGGNTWKQLTKGLPTAEDGLGRIGVAVAQSQPNRLYVTVEAKKNAGIYRSDDAGESWQQVNADHRIGGRGPGAMGIAVAPDHPEVLYVANTTPGN